MQSPDRGRSVYWHKEAKAAKAHNGGINNHLRVPHDIQQRHNVWSPGQVLQNLDFTLNLLLLDRLQHLNDAFLVVDDVDSLKHLGVFSAACVCTCHMSE